MSTEPTWAELAEIARARGDYDSERRFADQARKERLERKPESWEGYDQALLATVADLEEHPFTDWAHSHLLFPFVQAAVDRHFGEMTNEHGCLLVAAKLTGSIVAAKQGASDAEIAHAWSVGQSTYAPETFTERSMVRRIGEVGRS